MNYEWCQKQRLNGVDDYSSDDCDKWKWNNSHTYFKNGGEKNFIFFFLLLASFIMRI